MVALIGSFICIVITLCILVMVLLATGLLSPVIGVLLGFLQFAITRIRANLTRLNKKLDK